MPILTWDRYWCKTFACFSSGNCAFWNTFNTGYDMTRDHWIEDKVTIPVGLPNISRCFIVAQNFPVNVSLNFRDEDMSFSKVYGIAQSRYYSMVYGNRFSGFTHDRQRRCVHMADRSHKSSYWEADINKNWRWHSELQIDPSNPGYYNQYHIWLWNE